jgi:peptidyl-prolyl cis-trans isomerase D
LAEAGDFTIIPGVGGKRVVAVTAIEPGGTISFEEARADLVTRLSQDEARAAYLDIQDQIEELRAAFQPLQQIADRFKLPISTATVTSSGAELSVVAELSEEERARAAQAIFAGEAGKLAPTVTYGANRNLWFDIKAVEPARDQTLEEVREAVRTAWTDAKTEEALRAQVDAMMADLDGGKSFTDLAAERNQFPLTSAPFTRDGDGTPIINSAVATNVFASGPDSHGWAVNGDGEYVVYHVTDVTPPTDAPSKDIADFLANANRDALYADFVAGLTDELWPTSVRGAAYQRMLTLLTTTSTQ